MQMNYNYLVPAAGELRSLGDRGSRAAGLIRTPIIWKQLGHRRHRHHRRHHHRHHYHHCHRRHRHHHRHHHRYHRLAQAQLGGKFIRN